MMVWRGRGVASTAASLPLLLCCGALLVTAALADTDTDSESEPADRQQALDLGEEGGNSPSSRGPTLASILGLPNWMSSFFPTTPPTSTPALTDAPSPTPTTSATSPELGEFGNWWTRAQNFVDRMGNAKTVDDRLKHVLGALEGLDDLLRSTVPRMDRFNCLERVMCEMAAPLGIGGGGDGGNFLEDGVQTLQQISNSPLLQQFPDRLFQGGSQQQQFDRPHQQQFLQQQQHQTRLIRQQVQQQQQHVQPEQLPQQPVIPPLPYYIPTPLETSQQQFREQQEDLVARGTSSEDRTHHENTIRRDERYPGQQYQYQQQHLPSQQVYQYQERPYQQGQHPQYHTNQPYQYQQASVQYPQYAPQNATPLRRRRQPPAWRRIFNNFMGIGQNGSGGPNRRRGKRDAVESPAPPSSRQSKIAPIFKSDKGEVESLPTRQSKVAPEFKTTDVSGAKRKEEGPAPVKTLTKADLDDIRKKIAAINNDVVQNANSNGTSSVTFQGRQYSGRQARFLDTLLNGWTAKSLLGVLDNLMDGYSFHPYTHAAYMGYTSRSGTCSSMYPKCPDSANDMLDVVNNIHRYFPGGLPFKDSIPWPLNLLLP